MKYTSHGKAKSNVSLVMGRNSFYLLSVFVILDSIFTIARLQIIVEAVGTK